MRSYLAWSLAFISLVCLSMPIGMAESKRFNQIFGTLSLAMGIASVSFHTPQGRIIVNLPDDISSGDTISGSVQIDPVGRNDNERIKNQKLLDEYVIFLANAQTVVKDGDFTCQFSDSQAVSDLILKDRYGAILCVQALRLQPSLMPAAFQDTGRGASKSTKAYRQDFGLPKLGETGRPAECLGEFDGNFGNTEIKVGGKSVMMLAESPRKLIFESPTETVGPTFIELTENGRSKQANFSNLAIKVSMLHDQITKGQCSSVLIKVAGLTGISYTVPIRVVNRTPQVVSLAGGNTQVLYVSAKSGTAEHSLRVRALESGKFAVVAFLDLKPDLPAAKKKPDWDADL
jgi:hypothetical protein